MKTLIDTLAAEHALSADEFALLLRDADDGVRTYAMDRARDVSRALFGNAIYVRGLVEFTNYCKNDCLYCGIRRGNRHAARYRLDKDDILAACREGAALGFRTFVLQGGEDDWYTDERLTDIVRAVRREHPDAAITLSAGERTDESYRLLFEAGADRYLLRHETADPGHYALLHPASLSLASRTRCLYALKAIGFQTGSGFMVGSPGQTPEHIAKDLLFLRELEPEMIGIGPFIPHRDTPFADCPAGSVRDTLFLLALVRLMLPRSLIPATTALGTLDPEGREKGVLAGANVLMPNLSPPAVRKKYLLYDDKICTDDEAAENVEALRRRMAAIGYELADSRGDYPGK